MSTCDSPPECQQRNDHATLNRGKQTAKQNSRWPRCLIFNHPVARVQLDPNAPVNEDREHNRADDPAGNEHSTQADRLSQCGYAHDV
jgi:hypothetical protein